LEIAFNLGFGEYLQVRIETARRERERGVAKSHIIISESF
jgi:hypothetical protein